MGSDFLWSLAALVGAALRGDVHLDLCCGGWWIGGLFFGWERVDAFAGSCSPALPPPYGVLVDWTVPHA